MIIRNKSADNAGKYEGILFLVTAYFILVLISIFTILIIDNYVSRRTSYLYGLMSNERERVDINDIVKSRLDNMRNYLHQYIHADSFKELERFEKLILINVQKIKSELDVLENGGTIITSYKVNYEGMDEVSHKHTYVSYKKSRFNLEVLELRAKIKELESFLDSFRDVVIDKIVADRSGSMEVYGDSSKVISVKTKAMVAFFDRLDESSNRLFIESRNEIESISDVINNSSNKFKRIKVVSNAVFGFFIGLSGIFLLIRVRSIISSRKAIYDELNDTNNNLEKIVKERTNALEAEITVRKKTERESVEKAQFLFDVIESFAHPFYVVDVNTFEVLIGNRAVYNLMGQDGKTCHEITHQSTSPCEGEEHPCPLKYVKKFKKPISMEHIHVLKNGEKRFYEVHGHPIFNADGEVVQMIEYSLDITDKKETESAIIKLNSRLEELVAERTRELELEIKSRQNMESELIRRESKLSCVIDNMKDAVIVIDEYYKIAYSNKSMEEITGFSQGNLNNKNFEDFISSSDRMRFSVWMKKVLSISDSSHIIKLSLRMRSGDWLPVEVTASNLINNEEINGVILNIRIFFRSAVVASEY